MLKQATQMKKKLYFIAILAVVMTVSVNTYAQETEPKAPAENTGKAKGDPDSKAEGWVASLSLNDPAKEARLKELISTHLKAVRDFYNTHDYTLVPEGINPTTGKTFSKLDRQVIINSTIPKTVHETLMAGLHKDLTDDQVELILDKYTIGKVAFTFNGYKSIVPNMTKEDDAFILTNLKAAREMAIDYKNIDEISAIFKIYKTKNEDYFTNNGRNWHQMFKAYADAEKAKKAAKQ